MFSTTARLVQNLSIRQPVFSSTIWSQARQYRSPLPTSAQKPSESPQGPAWDVLGTFAGTTSVSDRPIDEIWERNSNIAKQDLIQYPPANPYSGRSVHVVGGNVADAYQKLHNILQRNKVRPQLKLAERHEKKGEKRRRLSSERWRKQFAYEVRKKVQLVTKIRNRGA